MGYLLLVGLFVLIIIANWIFENAFWIGCVVIGILLISLILQIREIASMGKYFRCGTDYFMVFLTVCAIGVVFVLMIL